MTTLAFAGAVLAALALLACHAAAAVAFTSAARWRGATRVLAVLLVMAFSATAAFQWLIAMHRFFLTEALVLSALYAASAHIYLLRTRRSWPGVLATLQHDAAHLARLCLPRAALARAVACLALLAAALVLALIAAGLLQHGQRRMTREDAWSRSSVMGRVPRNWLPAAMVLDTLRTPARLAVTSGPARDADQLFLQPMLGERLQHRFEYVPVTRSGTIVDWFAPPERDEPADEAAWRGRLDERAITHVLCQAPRATELAWLEADAAHFRVRAGDRRTWGLYERSALR